MRSHQAFADRLIDEDLPRVLSVIGRPQLFPLLIDMLSCGAECPVAYALAFHRSRRPMILAKRWPVELGNWASDAYLAGMYVFDPFYRAFIDGRPEGLYRMADIAPEDFEESEFQAQIYSQVPYTDEIDLLLPLDGETAVDISLCHVEQGHRFDAAQLDTFRRLLPLVREISRLHFEFRRSRGDDEGVDTLHLKLQHALNVFGHSRLTRQEHRTLRLILRGYTSKMAATKLGIAEGTIKVHRKAIHRKLEVRTHAELTALFVNSTPFIRLDSDVDPLILYDSHRAPAPVAAWPPEDVSAGG